MATTGKVLKNAAIYSGASVLEKVASFVLLPVYAHLFHTQGYGIIGLVDAAVGILTITLAGGFHTATVRTYYEEPPERQSRVVSTSIVLAWLMALALVPIPMLASKWIAAVLLGDSRHWILLVLALSTLVIDIGGKSASTYLVIRHRSLLFSILGLSRMLLTIGLNVLLVVGAHMGLVGIFLSSLVTATIATAVFVFVAVRHEGLHFDRDIARRLWQFQFPLVAAEVLEFISRQSERVLVRFFVGLGGTGVLEMAYKFPPMLNIFFVAPFMLSWRTASMAVGNQPDAPKAIGRMLTGYVFLLAFGGLLLAVNIRPVLALLTPPEFWPAARIARIDIVTTILAGLVTYIQFGVIYTRQTKRLALIKSLVAPVKVAISFFMIRLFDLSGAAYSALITEVVLLLWIGRASQSVYKINIEYARILGTSLAAVGLFLIIEYIDVIPGGPLDLLADQVPLMLNWVRRIPVARALLERVVNFLDGHEREVAALMFNTVASSAFLGVMPMLHPRALRSAIDLIRGARPETVGTA